MKNTVWMTYNGYKTQVKTYITKKLPQDSFCNVTYNSLFTISAVNSKKKN